MDDEAFDDIVEDSGLPYTDTPTSEVDDSTSIESPEPAVHADPSQATSQEAVTDQANPDDTLARITAERDELARWKEEVDAKALADKAQSDAEAARVSEENRRRAEQVENQFVTGYSNHLAENGLTKEAEQFRGFANALRRRVVVAEQESGQRMSDLESVIYAAQLLVPEESSAEIFQLADTLAGISDPAQRSQYGLDYVNHKLTQAQSKNAAELRIAELEAENARLKGGINPADHVVDSAIGSAPTGKTWEEMDFDDVFAEASAGF